MADFISEVEKSVKIRYGGGEIQKDDAPQYLDLQLDPKLSMRTHIENTAAKARRRLNIVKKLASTKWGANKQTLRQLYMGYIRPTLEYSSAALSTATHTNLATLDKVQNQALRFISGAMKTTQTSAFEIECNIEPLDIRRDAAIVTTYVTDILTTANKLHNQNDVETSIQWIPGHCDIPGNYRADKLARQGTSKTQHEQVSYAISKQIVQTKSRKIWHDRWARGNTGRIYYQHQQTPNQTDPINQLHRAHRTAVFRLRTHHAPLNAHLHRVKKEHPAKCVYCPDSDETIEHFLYDNIRSRLLPAQPNIHNTLYGSTTQLQRTATYNMSAMNRPKSGGPRKVKGKKRGMV